MKLNEEVDLVMNDEFSFRDIVELAQDVIIVTKAYPLDPPGPEIVYVNPAFTRLTGFSAKEAIGKTPRMLQGPETSKLTTHEIRASLDRQEPVHVAIKDYTKDGRDYWLDMSIMPLRNKAGEVTHFVAIERDVSLQKELEAKLQNMAERDALTGLYNRRKFFEDLKKAWQAFLETGECFSLISIDIDHFKDVNDQYGHNAGDTVLSELARVFQQSCRATDIVARIGGEEFAILLPGIQAQDAFVIAERIRQNVDDTEIKLDTQTLHRTISLGVSQVVHVDQSTTEMVKRADSALYNSKDQGRNRTSLC